MRITAADGDLEQAASSTRSLRALWIHSAALLVVLLSFLALHHGTVAVPDEGVYLLQASNLVDGGWASGRPAPDVDVDAMFVPVNDGGVSGDQVAPYTRHPLFPIVLAPALAVGGLTGALIVSVVGTWCAALTAAFIARRIRRGYGPWALWMLGLASPLLFDAYIALAHSLAAAAAGLAFLGVTRAVDGRRWAHLAYALPAVALVVGLRTEGLLFAAALSLTLGVMALGWPPLKRVDWPAVVVSVSTLAVAGVTYLAEAQAVRLILGNAASDLSPTARLSSGALGIMDGLWASVFRPFADSWIDAQVYLPLAAIAVILAALAVKVAPSRTTLPLGLLIMAAAASIGLLFTPPGLVTGLLPAFALLPAGLILLRSEDLRQPMIARALIVSLLTTGAILATNYSNGGSTEWGGRFLHLLLPLLVPVVVLGLDRGRQSLSAREAIVALSALVVVGAAVSITAMRALVDLRSVNQEVVEQSVRQATAVAGGDRPLIVTATIQPNGVARIYWDQLDQVDVLASGDLRTVNGIMLLAADAGRDGLTIMTNVNPDLMAQVITPALDELGWEVQKASITPNGVAAVVTVGEPRPD